MPRSRAAILPFPGDPLLFHYWLGQFDRVWQDEVDVLYVYHNSTAEPAVREYIKQECLKRPKIHLLESFTQVEHGDVIDRTLMVCDQEYVMLIEDDCFIFKPERIDTLFTDLESGNHKIIGSKRGSCSMEILSRAQQIWGLDYTGYGDQGCNFWPNLFFSPKEVLTSTDRRFAARSWKRGEEIEALSTPREKYLAQDEVVNGDTFVNTSLQLHAKYPKNDITYIPQYHGSPDDLKHFEEKSNLFDGVAPWVHVGSLSSGVGGILTDEQGRALIRRTVDLPRETGDTLPGYVRTDGEKNEWERRVQWWLTFYEQRDKDEIPEFAELYLLAINRVIRQYGLSIKNIRRRQEAYRTLNLP